MHILTLQQRLASFCHVHSVNIELDRFFFLNDKLPLRSTVSVSRIFMSLLYNHFISVSLSQILIYVSRRLRNCVGYASPCPNLRDQVIFHFEIDYERECMEVVLKLVIGSNYCQP